MFFLDFKPQLQSHVVFRRCGVKCVSSSVCLLHCAHTHCHCNSASLGTTSCCALAAHIKKRIIIFVIPVPAVSSVTAQNSSQRLQLNQVPCLWGDIIITWDYDQCGQEKTEWINIENNKSAVDAFQLEIAERTHISGQQLGSLCVCACVCV